MIDSHVLEGQSAGCGVGDSSDEVGEETETDALGTDGGRPDLRRPDERGGVHALVGDNVHVQDDQTANEASRTASTDVLPL
jgi:hypothetical protein